MQQQMWPIARIEHAVAAAALSRRPSCVGSRLPLSWKLLLPFVALQLLYVLIKSSVHRVTLGKVSAHPFRASELRTSYAQTFAEPYGPLLVLSLLSYVLAELGILPASQGVDEDDDGVGPL